MLGVFLLILMFLLALGSLPAWPHSREWSYFPSRSFGVLFIVVLVLMITDRI
ncbi:MAG: DUF3309 family protein [Nibricoccus sp.]